MTVQEIEISIKKLPIQKLIELSNWLEEYQARVWDKQIEDDLANGHLDSLLAEVDYDQLLKGK